MEFSGNVVSGRNAGFGKVSWDGATITGVEIFGDIRPDADWVLPGFIDTHVHGFGDGYYDDNMMKMSEAFPVSGVTGFLPTSSSIPPSEIIKYLETVKAGAVERHGAKILGAHLEGPFLSQEFAGGMNQSQLRLPDLSEVDQWLQHAGNMIKIVTLAPELPGAEEVIRKLTAAGVAVALGHTALEAADLPRTVDAGVSRVCHLYDAYAGRPVIDGVSVPALTDMVLLDDRLMLEIICDGCHVPPPMAQLAIRTAGIERIVAISDALKGAGKPDGIYSDSDGRAYKLDNSDVCRTTEPPYMILGSCLTMNRAFYNLVNKFGCTPVEASLAVSGNPARSIGMGDKTGTLAPGLAADIVLLGSDMLTVKETVIDGRIFMK